MPRLLRVHFASIGHQDARLAPLQLDFRHAGDGPEAGTGADTILWLRNGGGKSSILNLFYSVFRPNTREFLGSSAEGKSRRLDQYVKGRDLAFVITEWDVAPAPGPTLFAQAPSEVRIVGQMLAWKGQQRSQDAANLRRLFFSLKSGPLGPALEDLPVQGLATSAPSFDAFRDWLKDLGTRMSDTEVMWTEQQRVWQEHLEKIGLDPELFRYQLMMNEREGAADEVFRFKRDDEFVRFLLELAFDNGNAIQIGRNLEAQRENLRARPRWELERRFLGSALESVRALALAATGLRDAEKALALSSHDVAATVVALDGRVSERHEAAQVERGRATAEHDRGRRAANERDKKLRWSKGLERLALQLDEAEARRALDDAEAFDRELADELATTKAANALSSVRRVEAEIAERRAALARAMDALEPLRLEAARHGAIFAALLSAEERRLQGIVDGLGASVGLADAAEREANETQTHARATIAARETELKAIDDRIARRDRAREKLLDDGHILAREAAYEALDRWEQVERDVERALFDGERRRREIADVLAATRQRRDEAAAEHARLEEQARALLRRVDAALAWRDRLQRAPPILELEGVDEVNLDSSGLEARVLHRIELARRRVLDSRVDGAQDTRSLEWLRQHGLLPSTVDVARVVEAIRSGGVTAHAGPEYLAQNIPVDQRRTLLAADPARFSGVVVPDEESLARASALKMADLRAPVQVSILRHLGSPPEPTDAIVLPPDAALYDPAAAESRRVEFETTATRRAEREHEFETEEAAFRELVGELTRFLAEHGRGKLDALVRESDGAQRQTALMTHELARLDGEAIASEQRKTTVERELEAAHNSAKNAAAARVAVRSFLDAHETELETVRARRDAAAAEQRAARDAAAEAAVRVEHERQRRHDLDVRRNDFVREHRALVDERESIAHRDAELDELPDVTLARARAGYATARRQYDQEVSDNQLKWEIEQFDRQRADLATAFQRLAQGRDRTRLDALAAREDLVDEVTRIEQTVLEHHRTLAERKHAHDQAKHKLDASRIRRDAEDLPADRERPTDAEEARAIAKDLEAEIETHYQEERDADAARTTHERRGSALEREATSCKGLASNLRSTAEGAGVGLTWPAASVQLPEADVLEASIEEQRRTFTEACSRLTSARARATSAAEAVRGVANRTEFSELRAQYQERMKSATDTLFEDADTLADELAKRLAVVEQALAKLDEDRRLIVDELLYVADSVAKLLQRVENAARMPATLEGWAGKPYVRIVFAFPGSDAEKRARLEPMVDQLVSLAQIPSGVDLVVRTATELAGAKGFEVKILKPDTVLRPDPVPLHLLSTFSRGQQLTAAILLYCMLVQLRARTRGRSQSAQDAGVLILDNPIGTCSNVRLLQLQRDIAAQMRVQLIYTTGVEDLEALETLPNKIRLRNTHRDRATGDRHVTSDESDRGAVDAVRLVEVPAR